MNAHMIHIEITSFHPPTVMSNWASQHESMKWSQTMISSRGPNKLILNGLLPITFLQL